MWTHTFRLVSVLLLVLVSVPLAGLGSGLGAPAAPAPASPPDALSSIASSTSAHTWITCTKAVGLYVCGMSMTFGIDQLIWVLFIMSIIIPHGVSSFILCIIKAKVSLLRFHFCLIIMKFK